MKSSTFNNSYISGLEHEALYQALLSKLDKATEFRSKGKEKQAEEILRDLVDDQDISLGRSLFAKLNSDQSSLWSVRYGVEECSCCGDPFLEYQAIKGDEFQKLPPQTFVGKLARARIRKHPGLLQIEDYLAFPLDAAISRPYELSAKVVQVSGKDQSIVGQRVVLWRSEIESLVTELTESK